MSPVSDRCVYGGVAEVSVYVGAVAWGKGVGTPLLTALIEESEGAGFWWLRAQMFLENAASVALHKKCGFREVVRQERVARMNHGPMKGVWRNVLLLERRSSTVGV